MEAKNCPRCDGPLTLQVTARRVHIMKCKKKSEGGCGLFINLGHVKDGEVASVAREAIAEVKAEVTPPASVEGGGSGTGTVKPKPKRKPVRRTKEPVRVEAVKRVEPIQRGGFLSGLIKRHFSGVGDDI